MKYLSLLFVLFCFSQPSWTQTTTISGSVEDALTGEPLIGVEVRLRLQQVFTDLEGRFSLSIAQTGQPVLIGFYRNGYQPLEEMVSLRGRSNISLGIIRMSIQENIDQITGEDLIPAVSLAEDDTEDNGVENISGLLTASNDIFVSTAAFVFGPARFQIRGYDAENTLVLMNGVPVNDPESGRIFWSQWGGLNDVLRNRNNSVGLASVPYSFGGIGGATALDTRASRQRRQLRVSYALSNRTYRNRLMGTYSTGWLRNGWAFSVSGSRRWAEEGYVDGTFYDAWSYFLSADKKLGQNHLLNLTAFGAPVKRGMASAGTQEMYDIAGTNYYNPNWGFQNGEKRNARVFNAHQPMFILRHDWKIGDRTNLTTAASFQSGRNGSTALDWYDARDPRPDYYRRLPSFIENEQREAVEQALRQSEAARQIDWDYFYEVNRHNFLDIENANGIEGNTVSGNRAQYIVEDRRFDSDRLNVNSFFESIPSRNLKLSGGGNFQAFRGHNFKMVDDLLGADFYLDIDKFAEFDSTTNVGFFQNDLDRPNHILRDGDTFGYDYEMNILKGSIWLQADLTFRHLDLFLGLEGSNTSFWRTGNVRNGKFPEDSSGNSEKQRFANGGIKAGVTFKIDARNYLLLNGAYLSRAPFARNAYVSPRTRHQEVPGLKSEKLLALEAGYLLRAPYAKARVMGYFTRMQDQLFNRSFYLDNAIVSDDGVDGGFVNYLMSGINTQHAGLEIGGEFTVLSGFKVIGVAALGQYIYTNRPTVSVFLDNRAEELRNETIYIKNFYVAGMPQTALSFGLDYNAPKFWFAKLNFNYYNDVYIDFNPDRRTVDAVSYSADPQFSDQVVEPGSALWNQILYQEKAEPAFTLDFFGGKSWKINDFFIYLNIGVSNILDNQDFVTGGFEQFRFDYEDKNIDRFPNRYFYSFGRTYFFNLAFRL